MFSGADLNERNLSKGDFLYNGLEENQKFMLKDSNEFLISSNYLVTDSKIKKISTQNLYTNKNFKSKSLVRYSQENCDIKNSFKIFERNPFSYFKEYYKENEDIKKSVSDTGIISNAFIDLSTDNIIDTNDTKLTGTDAKVYTIFKSFMSAEDSSKNCGCVFDRKMSDIKNKYSETEESKQKKYSPFNLISDNFPGFLSTLECTPDYYRKIFGPTLDETILSGMDIVYKKLEGSKKSKKYQKTICINDFSSSPTTSNITTDLSRIVSSTGINPKHQSNICACPNLFSKKKTPPNPPKSPPTG